MPEWEYKTVTHYGMNHDGHSLECWLDELGFEGWELCSVVEGLFIFKRPKTEA